MQLCANFCGSNFEDMAAILPGRSAYGFRPCLPDRSLAMLGTEPVGRSADHKPKKSRISGYHLES